MTTSSIRIIMLAAGQARRMGMPKQLLVADGQPLIRRLASDLLTLGHPLSIVLGARAELIRPVLEDLPLSVLHNPEWSSGMAGTLKVGLRHALEEDPELQAVILCLSDQPFLSAELLQRMIAAYEEEGQAIVACEYQSGVVGVPLLIDRQLFDELLELEGKIGARSLIDTHHEELITVNFALGDKDLDHPEDWERYLEDREK